MSLWYVLDPFQQPMGPLSEQELPAVLADLGDALVITEGMPGWRRASEVVPPALLAAPVPVRRRARTMRATGADGQPTNRRFNAKRRADREVNELLGLVKGVIADGAITDAEIVALDQWLQGHQEATCVWPVDVLSERIRRVLDDGIVDDEERAELADLLHQVTGTAPDGTAAMRGATQLPLTDPPPFIEYTGRLFVLTGKFVYGTRAACEAAVLREGGGCADTPSGKVHYLIIGALASADWAHSSYGRKIERAVELSRQGVPIAIVGEEYWSSTLT